MTHHLFRCAHLIVLTVKADYQVIERITSTMPVIRWAYSHISCLYTSKCKENRRFSSCYKELLATSLHYIISDNSWGLYCFMSIILKTKLCACRCCYYMHIWNLLHFYAIFFRKIQNKHSILFCSINLVSKDFSFAV